LADAAVVIQQGAGTGAEHPIEDELILGREQGAADLVIEDPGVSRRHARFIAEGGSVVVEDLGSSNGTFVNGERIAGPVEVGSGDEVQLGATVLGVQGADAATALIGAGADPTAEHPGPARARRAQPPAGARPAPRRLAPRPSERGNVPALAALFLGPLSILLLLFSTGAAFFVSLPCAIAAIVLGTIGMRNVDRGRAEGHRGLAHLGRVTGIIGAVLSVIALIAFVVVATALDATEDSVSGLIDKVRDEIEGVDTPDLNAPDVNAPDVNAPEVPESGGDSGGAEPGGSEPGGAESGGAESGGSDPG
jgi:pSer/pThr/pTyr-binding forkhead associated (FHA) protein